LGFECHIDSPFLSLVIAGLIVRLNDIKIDYKMKPTVMKLDSHSKLELYESFLQADHALLLFEALRRQADWKSQAIKLFGREVLQPRLVASYADAGVQYGYSGLKLKSALWLPELAELKKRIERVLAPLYFNSLLLNYYRHQQDSMGWHRDNEKELGSDPVIASLSLGATRDFHLRRYADKSNLQKLSLTNGSLLVMSGRTQHDWEHCLPKRQRKIGERINLTFRLVQPG
jgi:alkylated DNA repair dioxygenase AlkB